MDGWILKDPSPWTWSVWPVIIREEVQIKTRTNGFKNILYPLVFTEHCCSSYHLYHYGNDSNDNNLTLWYLVFTNSVFNISSYKLWTVLLTEYGIDTGTTKLLLKVRFLPTFDVSTSHLEILVGLCRSDFLTPNSDAPRLLSSSVGSSHYTGNSCFFHLPQHHLCADIALYSDASRDSHHGECCLKAVVLQHFLYRTILFFHFNYLCWVVIVKIPSFITWLDFSFLPSFSQHHLLSCKFLKVNHNGSRRCLGLGLRSQRSMGSL